jgi:fumarate hydratase class II
VSLLDIAEPQGRNNGRASPDRIFRDRAALEAMSMVCTHVIGLDQVGAGSRGNRAPRALCPLVVVSVLNAIRTLSQACVSVRGTIAPAGRK